VGAVSGFPFSSVLVANRGEIARRVIRTLKRLGLRSIAVYSDVDAEALHVEEADEAVRIGPAEARASYLSVPALLAAARGTGAGAVHPGYGFLSENAAFARALADAGIAFVGPPAEVLEASADKLVVKRRVAAAGVPVIPGPLDAAGETPGALEKAAQATGYPLLLKAASGGGGKGMRTVARAAELAEAAESARREAGGAFGSTVLYMERQVAAARHVEVQVLCDAHGGVLVLGERDCSVQRRHQKVLEESPAPGLAPDLRRRLHEAGAAAAKALGYRNAGTVEFLVDTDGRPWFLEVNRRLQVEHPVTEAVFGLDLVEWQLRVAAGERVPAQVPASRGHAIEARIYAEDPAQEFLPSCGKILALVEPTGVRVDAAWRAGLAVTPHYDPLLAKVIAHAETRPEALARLDRALAETVVLGVRTNVGYLRAILADEDFRTGRLTTDLLERRGARLREPRVDDLDVLLAAAAEELLGVGAAGAPRPEAGGKHGGGGEGRTRVPSPWDTLIAFRLGEGGRLGEDAR
jgi:acetyl-CoA/propionyl-CoA carboxylase, biotin carboxylase, biotin carboxyl carrier protein